MFEFFIALFGGMYSGGKLLSEMHNKRIGDRQFASWEKRFDAWQALVLDKALEEDLRDYINNHENRESVWSEIQDAYKQMRFQKSYDSANDWVYDGVMDKTRVGRELYRRHRFEEPLDIMLSKHGKLRAAASLSAVIDLMPGEGQRTKGNWDRTVAFWIYIRDELRRQGVDAQLLFKCKDGVGRSTGEYFDVDDIDKFRYRRGNLEWLPHTRVGI